MLGLRTTIYQVPDLAAAKAWYTKAFAKAPYFDEPFYVGFNIGGFELGLLPAKKPLPANPTMYSQTLTPLSLIPLGWHAPALPATPRL